MTNIYNAIQNLYHMDKETWQEVLSEMYTLVNNTSLKFDTFEQKFLLHLGNEVTKELKKMYDDGRLGDLINDVLLKDINTKVDNNYTTLDNKIDTVNSELNSQLDTIVINNSKYNIDNKGNNDTSQQLVNANADNYLTLSKGAYRISKDTTLGKIKLLNGAYFIIDENVTLTLENNETELNQLCFKGKGTVIIKNNRYSLAWYEGKSANEKWDFMRKGFSQGVNKYVKITQPSINDLGATINIDGGVSWKIDNSFKFNDNENCLIFDSEARFIVTSEIDDAFIFSTINKSEEITFPNGLWLEGGVERLTPLCNNGIRICGGARIKFNSATRLKTFKENCLLIDNYYFGNDEIQFDFLEVTGYGKNGVYLIGNNKGNVNTYINYLFSNGALLNAENLVKIEGKIRSLTINKINENTALSVGYNDIINSIIAIESNVNGNPQNLTINDIYAHNTTKPLIKSYNNGGSIKNNNIYVNSVYSNNSQILIDLSYTINSKIDCIQEKENSININSDCQNISLNTNISNVIGSCPLLKINNKICGKYVINSNSVITLDVLPLTTKCDLCCVEDQEGSSSLILRNGGAIVPIYKGTNVVNTTGKLSGTSGTDLKINLSYFGGKLYIENRTSSSRTIYVFIEN